MRFLPKRSRRPLPPESEPVDHSLATAAIQDAVRAHTTAQAQATQAREVVAQLRQVNIRNGFAPAIESTIIRRLGGAS